MAALLKCGTVEELKNRMTAREFKTWRHLIRAVPFDHERTAIGLAINSYLLANIHRGKGQREFRIKDFLVSGEIERPKKAQTAEEVMAMLTAMATFHGGGGVGQRKD